MSGITNKQLLDVIIKSIDDKNENLKEYVKEHFDSIETNIKDIHIKLDKKLEVSPEDATIIKQIIMKHKDNKNFNKDIKTKIKEKIIMGVYTLCVSVGILIVSQIPFIKNWIALIIK